MLPLDDDPPLAPLAPRAPVHLPWTLRLREMVLSYLPLLLMALLALATWWLVKNTPGAPATSQERVLRHEPDYLMQGFRLQRFAATGELRMEIEGTQMRHYPDTDTFEIDEVRLRSLGEDGSVLRATARRALSDGKGTQVQLLGAAQVVREAPDGGAPVQVRSEFLRVFTEEQRVQTDQPVQVLQGSNDIRAAGVDYDHRSGVARYQGPARARFDPPGRRR
ncbi:LPS export ABC transporter periplasmic protein LptC [Azohydromonas aeria]|uniref:LPS export ABC transporter periplasmic protein LptC n=1 Tax=Azohydromonas aeria TaxID=2590212 RepID=UPI0012FBCB3A|nr:LPS export ABC transporter periplasmic protein LptC [Azohydromonas aeria]